MQVLVLRAEGVPVQVVGVEEVVFVVQGQGPEPLHRRGAGRERDRVGPGPLKAVPVLV